MEYSIVTCIKTGFHGYLEEYNEWVYGDAYALDPRLRAKDGEEMSQAHLEQYLAHKTPLAINAVYLFTIAGRSMKPYREVKHFTIHNVCDWVGNRQVIFTNNITNHGYEGIPI